MIQVCVFVAAAVANYDDGSRLDDAQMSIDSMSAAIMR